MQTFRARLLFLIPLICLLLLTVQHFVPSLYSSLLGQLDPATNTTCGYRCGPKETIVDTTEEGTSYGETTITTTATEDPVTPWLRTGFDSSVVAPPYLLILGLVLLFCSWFLWHYLQWIRRPRIDASGYVLTPRFPIFIYETKDLPADSIRKQLAYFNEQLPLSLQRRTSETVTEWFDRIAFPSPVDPIYFEVRYGKLPVISTHQLTFFVQAMEQYLRKCQVRSSIS
ncbi:hypothetical protein ACRPK8_14225 [Exiguobacterium sp. TDN 0502]|uniref:hypothetical protein n=1 Tax=Exiguobacterium sp. TDN 0502 TaxID=3420731 RepID=UPI003D789FB3